MSEFQVTTIEPRPIIYVSRSSPMAPAEIGKALGDAYALLQTFAKERGLDIVGQPMAVYHGINNDIVSFDPALPLAAHQLNDAADGGPIRAGHTPAGKAVKTVHVGPYSALGATYKAMMAFMETQGLKPAGPCYEVYVSDPGTTPEAELRTEVYWPVG